MNYSELEKQTPHQVEIWIVPAGKVVIKSVVINPLAKGFYLWGLGDLLLVKYWYDADDKQSLAMANLNAFLPVIRGKITAHCEVQNPTNENVSSTVKGVWVERL